MNHTVLVRITVACAALSVLAVVAVLTGVRVGELGALGTLLALALVPADMGVMTGYAARQQRRLAPAVSADRAPRRTVR